DPGRRKLAALTPDVHGNARLGPELGLAPSDDVVLERARTSVVDVRAVLEWDATVIREQQLIEAAQPVVAPVDVLAARGLARVAVHFEQGHDRLGVARCKCTLVLPDHV